MLTPKRIMPWLMLAMVAAGIAGNVSWASESPEGVVVRPAESSFFEKLAAQEIRRYVYACTGTLLPVVESLPAAGPAIVVAGEAGRLTSTVDAPSGAMPDAYRVASKDDGGRRVVYITGRGGVGVLYGAYRFAELLGARFYLDGDVLPEPRMPFALPEVNLDEAPLFELRGIQPFHDFPEGPDWWNPENYAAILAQLPKLRMNFFGLHTYPEKRPNAEATTWIGIADDINADGSVKTGYPAIYYNTALPVNWGFQPKKTSEYACGAALLFDRDDYGSAIMRGLTPMPDAPEACAEVFNRAGAMFNDVFGLARTLGIKTCLGTETPLVVPQRVLERMGISSADRSAVQRLYEGMFTRIMKAHPLDYYWFWTPENWTWSGVEHKDVQATLDDILIAIDAAKKVGAPFQLATCGWVLGPQYDRALFDNAFPKDMPVSCINRAVGHDPVEPGFARVSGRPKWAIPWLEDDPAMSSPQLWVGRMRRDAYDALRYSCTGLMGIHWRTRILGPNVSSLAQAAWEQSSWRDLPVAKGEGPVGGEVARFDGAEFAGTEQDALYQNVRYDVQAYRFAVPNGAYSVTLHFAEPHYRETGKRIFGVMLEDKQVISSLDIFAKAGPNTALDYTFDGVNVTDGRMDIEFTKEVEYPCIAALAIAGPEKTIRINCGGPAVGDYAEDPPKASESWPTTDFWGDWATSQFGPEAGPAAAAIFEKIDGKLPRPSNWIDGPGGYAPDDRPWEKVQPEYAFVDELESLQGIVLGPAHQERFAYWLDSFKFMRATARMSCARSVFNKALEKAKQATDPAQQRELAQTEALPAWRDMVAAVTEAYQHLLAASSTTGEMGTVANLEQHTFPVMLDAPGNVLAGLLGETLPEDACLPKKYEGPARLIVPMAGGTCRVGKAFTIQAIVLAKENVQAVTVFWRPLGTGVFADVPMVRGERNTFTTTLQPSCDFEYYVKATTVKDKSLIWPAGAPEAAHTVVALPE